MAASTIALPALVALAACADGETKSGGDENVVENVPGSLVITSPARASFVPGKDGDLQVRGSGATKALTINGSQAKVSADGSFEATIEPHAGLNVIEAVDGESRLALPFLYGEFAPADRPVPHAIAIDIGALGLSAPAPEASLSAITNLALTGRDLMATLRGKSFGGNVLGQEWTFELTSGSHGALSAGVSAANRGPNVQASVKDLVIDGTIRLGSLSRPVHITSTEAKITGVAEPSVDQDGALRVGMPAADIDLAGFLYSATGNGTLDTIISTLLRPLVEKGIADAVRDEIPKALKLTLDGIGLPKELDLAAAGLVAKVPIATRFDGAAFDQTGGTLTVATLFGGPFAPGTPGSQAPGWLTLAGPYTPGAGRPSSLGVSISLDAVNQLFFAAWGTGSLSLVVPTMKLTPALPPLVMVDGSGNLQFGLGEVMVQREGQEKPMAAVTILQNIEAAAEGDGVVLTPKGEPSISITWLVGQGGGGGILDAVAEAARGQLTKVLKPIHVPLPKISLEKIGTQFAGQSLRVKDAKITVDRRAGRVSASGSMSFVK